MTAEERQARKRAYLQTKTTEVSKEDVT